MDKPIFKKSVEEAYKKNYASDCVTREMTPEEYEKYFGEGEKMERKNTSNFITSNKNPNCKVSKAELVEFCRIHGTSWKGAAEIAQITGLSTNAIMKYINLWILGEEKEKSLEVTAQNNSNNEQEAIDKELEQPEMADAESREDDPTSAEQLGNNQEICPEKESGEIEMTLKIRSSVYKVGNAIVQINFENEWIGIAGGGGSNLITFREAAAIASFLQELL